ncbi:cytosine permease [uncultured Arthrobacter sp.]|uniref:purine-cytosine permease family protein n=1 Tax=uncultured Arthrobacter sp. TaxID=114050 RepID=UPI0025F80C8C|nr:cytosine permease [uncultured Arthrobacter sp.]
MSKRTLIDEHQELEQNSLGMKSAVESHSIDFIPEHERHGTAPKQAIFWTIANFNIFSIALGFIGPSLGLSLVWTIVAGAAGGIFGGIFVSFHASQGPRLGLPQMIQSRAQFGYRGVLIPTIAVLFNFIVFNVLQTDVLKSGLNGVFGWNPTAIIIAVSAIAALLAIFGHNWLHKVFRVLFWVSAPFYLVLTIGMFTGGAATQEPSSPGGFSATAFMIVFATAMSYNLTLAPYVSDYTRYLPATIKTSHVVLAVQSGICFSLIWLMSMGAWLATHVGATDALVGLNMAGNTMFPVFGTATALLSVAGLIAVIGINTYSAGIAVATVIDCFKPIRSTRRLRIACTVGLLLVWGTINLNLQGDQTVLITNLLSILLYLLVPWTAVNLVDFFIVRKGHYSIAEIEQRDGMYGTWAWRGLTAYAAGLLFEVPFMVLSFYKGPATALTAGIDISFVIGLIGAGAAYLVLSRSLKLDSELARIEEHPGL